MKIDFKKITENRKNHNDRFNSFKQNLAKGKINNEEKEAAEKIRLLRKKNYEQEDFIKQKNFFVEKTPTSNTSKNNIEINKIIKKEYKSYSQSKNMMNYNDINNKESLFNNRNHSHEIESNKKLKSPISDEIFLNDQKYLFKRSENKPFSVKENNSKDQNKKDDFFEYKKLQEKLNFLENKIMNIKSNIENKQFSVKNSNKSVKNNPINFFNNNNSNNEINDDNKKINCQSVSNNHNKAKKKENILQNYVTQVNLSKNFGNKYSSEKNNQKNFFEENFEIEKFKNKNYNLIDELRNVYYVKKIIESFSTKEENGNYFIRLFREHLNQSIQAMNLIKSLKTANNSIFYKEKRVILPRKEFYKSNKI